MSKHVEEHDEIDLGQVASKSEQFIEKNKSQIGIALVVAIALGLGIYGYFKMYLPPLEQEASVASFQAQKYFAIDSFNLAMYGSYGDPSREDFMGFEEIANEYGATATGNLANYYMGISLLRTGDYEGAISYLNAFSKDDEMVSTVAIGATGDAYSELGDYDKALKLYTEAGYRNGNKFTSSIYLMKAGRLAQDLGNNAEAAKIFKYLMDEFPETQEGRNAKKFYEMSAAL